MKTLIISFSMIFSLGQVMANSGDNQVTTGQARESAGNEERQFFWENGLFSLTEINAGIGLSDVSSDYSNGFGGVNTVLGYRFTRAIQAGVGSGFYVYKQGTLLPLYLDGRIYLSRKRTKPFIAGSGGLQFRLSGEKVPTRLFAYPGVGLEVPVGVRSSFSFTAGIMSLNSKDYHRTSFLTVKAGVHFW